MRPANTLATILALMAPLLACAEASRRSLPERDLGLAIARAREVRLAPETGNYLWFRLSHGHYKPSRSEFVASLAYTGPRGGSDPIKIEATLVEAVEPIATQIRTYLEANPDAPIEAAARALRVERNDYHEDVCPAVREIHEQFSIVARNALREPSDTMGFYHGESLQIEGYTGNSYFFLWVQEDNPLFKWGTKAASALKRCQPL
jgi:hypothetical protein